VLLVLSAIIEGGAGTGWTLYMDKELLWGNSGAIKLFSMRGNLALNGWYSCLLVKTHVKIYNYKRKHAWVLLKNFYSTISRFNQKHLSLYQGHMRSVLLQDKSTKNWFYLWFLGVSDGFSSFTLVRQNNNWIFAFKITQPIFNLRLLYYIKKELGVGSVFKDSARCQFIISDRNKLKNIIFPIFDKYSLLTNKKINYLKFKQAYFILEDINLTPDEKDKSLFIIKDIIKSAQSAQLVRLVPSEGWNSPFLDLKSVNHIKSVITKPWIVGFIETKGRFYLDSKDSYPSSSRFAFDSQAMGTLIFSVSVKSNQGRIVNGFSIIQKFDGELLETIRSIFHISNKIKYNPDYNLYILNTTNSRGIKNIINYLQGTMKGMKALSFRLWSRAILKQYDVNKRLKIQRILHRTENKLSYPFTLSKKFSTQPSSIIAPGSLSTNVQVQLNPYYKWHNLNDNEKFKMWLVGFTDGDGCFSIVKSGGTYRLHYILSQSEYNIKLLYYIKQNLGHGSVSKSSKQTWANYRI